MKKFLFLIATFFFSYNLHSQVLISLIFGEKLNSPGLEFGLEGGVNYSQNNAFESNKSLGAFNLGFYFDIRLKNQLSLYTGVLVKSKMGAGKLTDADLDFLQTPTYSDDGTYSLAISYFQVPALLKYKFKNFFYLEAGPQFGLMHKSWIEFNYSEKEKKAQIRDYNKDQISQMDAGVTAGLGYKLMKGTGMTIGIKYYYGFVDVIKDKSGSNNSSLFLKMNIPIGAAKKSKKEID